MEGGNGMLNHTKMSAPTGAWKCNFPTGDRSTDGPTGSYGSHFQHCEGDPLLVHSDMCVCIHIHIIYI